MLRVLVLDGWRHHLEVLDVAHAEVFALAPFVLALVLAVGERSISKKIL